MTHQQTQKGDLVVRCATLLSASDPPGTLGAFNPSSLPSHAITTIQTGGDLSSVIKILQGTQPASHILEKTYQGIVSYDFWQQFNTCVLQI